MFFGCSFLSGVFRIVSFTKKFTSTEISRAFNLLLLRWRSRPIKYRLWMNLQSFIVDELDSFADSFIKYKKVCSQVSGGYYQLKIHLCTHWEFRISTKKNKISLAIWIILSQQKKISKPSKVSFIKILPWILSSGGPPNWCQ